VSLSDPHAGRGATRRTQRRAPGYRQIAAAVEVITDGAISVSHMTIRRDMDAMREAGAL